MKMNPLLKAWVNSRLHAYALRKFFLPSLFALLPKAPKRILELGCGQGDTTLLLLEKFPDATIVATDFDAEQVALANVRVVSPRLTVLQADASALPFADASFDLVIECNTFHHVERWTKALTESGRVLAPKGTFAAMDEDASFFNPLVRWLDQPAALFSKHEFVFAAEQAGLLPARDVGSKKMFRCTFEKS